MNINWFPGHMKKTRDLLIQNLKLVDIVYELLDARIPMSSKNPEIDKLVSNKPRIIILNKSDLSSDEGNEKWMEFYNKENTNTVLINAVKGVGVNDLLHKSHLIMEDKINRLKSKGIKNKPIRAMIVGIPNVGKSTLINALAGRKSAKTGNRPGVTKGKQWIKLKGNLELLDTPGILWPKFEDENVALNLAFIGAIKDEIMDVETLALRLIERLSIMYPELIRKRYNVEITGREPLEIFNSIAVKRGCLIKGGEIDYSRAAHLVLDEFRRGIIGRITLEYPNK
jgi:ribosome biogenesis GTPase A